MGKCAKRTKSVGRAIGKALTPVGVKLIGEIVGELANVNLSSSAKREAAYAAIKVSLGHAGIEARETAIRTAQEFAVATLKHGQEALSDLGTVDDLDLDGDGEPG